MRRWPVYSSVYCLIFKFVAPSRRYLWIFFFRSRLTLCKYVPSAFIQRSWWTRNWTIFVNCRQFQYGGLFQSHNLHPEVGFKYDRDSHVRRKLIEKTFRRHHNSFLGTQSKYFYPWEITVYSVFLYCKWIGVSELELNTVAHTVAN